VLNTSDNGGTAVSGSTAQWQAQASPTKNHDSPANAKLIAVLANCKHGYASACQPEHRENLLHGKPIQKQTV
jgi:hypothetical protein